MDANHSVEGRLEGRTTGWAASTTDSTASTASSTASSRLSGVDDRLGRIEDTQQQILALLRGPSERLISRPTRTAG